MGQMKTRSRRRGFINNSSEIEGVNIIPSCQLWSLTSDFVNLSNNTSDEP